jgi:hypothetical protein
MDVNLMGFSRVCKVGHSCSFPYQRAGCESGGGLEGVQGRVCKVGLSCSFLYRVLDVNLRVPQGVQCRPLLLFP